MKSGIEHDKLIRKILNEIIDTSKYKMSKKFIQHGNTSVYMHSVRVAYISCYIAERYNLKVDFDSLIMGALLHDYFLYDWHDKNSHHKRPHGFHHPSAALANAERDFDLNWRVKNTIKRHMFPLTPIPPKCLEGWIVCAADKICSTKETIKIIKF